MEAVLDPELAIIDSHHHLWHLRSYDYPPTVHEADLDSGHRIVATVCVEWGSGHRTRGPVHLRPVGELERLVATSLRPGVGAAFVGNADLGLGARVAEVIGEYQRVSSRLRGIRYSTAWDSRLDNRGRVAGMLTAPGVHEAIAALAPFELPIDCWVYGSQLADLLTLATEFPTQTFVIDHLGCPLLQGLDEFARREVLAEWRHGMGLLAEQPNIAVKLGGLGMPLLGAPWTAGSSVPPTSTEIATHWRDEVEFCIESFGSHRCMFESNFPIDRVVTDHRTIWNAYKRLAEQRPQRDRVQLFSATAARIYGLGDVSPSAVSE